MPQKLILYRTDVGSTEWSCLRVGTSRIAIYTTSVYAFSYVATRSVLARIQRTAKQFWRILLAEPKSHVPAVPKVSIDRLL